MSFHKSLQIFRTHNLIHLLVSNFCTFVGNLLKNCLANSAAPDKNQEKNHKCFRLVIVLVIVNVRNLCVFQRGAHFVYVYVAQLSSGAPTDIFTNLGLWLLIRIGWSFQNSKNAFFLLFILLYWVNLAPSRHRPFKLGFHLLRGSHQDHPLLILNRLDNNISLKRASLRHYQFIFDSIR